MNSSCNRPKCTTVIETITPILAAAYLERNTANRGVKQSIVKKYAKAMKTGCWDLTHQGIAFDSNGVLTDGQHRLQAIIASGCSVEMNVSRFSREVSRIHIDQHSRRSFADAMAIESGGDINKNVVTIARAIMRLASHDRGTETIDEVKRMYPVIEKPVLFVDSYLGESTKGISSAPAKAAITLAWFYVNDIDRLSKFCLVFGGKELPETEADKPAVMIREYLLKTGVRYSSMRLDGFCKMQRAIDSFCSYKPVSKLYGSRSIFPWPLIDPVRR